MFFFFFFQLKSINVQNILKLTLYTAGSINVQNDVHIADIWYGLGKMALTIFLNSIPHAYCITSTSFFGHKKILVKSSPLNNMHRSTFCFLVCYMYMYIGFYFQLSPSRDGGSKQSDSFITYSHLHPGVDCFLDGCRTSVCDNRLLLTLH